MSKNQTKLIRDLEWVIKVITSHSLYTYELKDNELIQKYSNENQDFKQFVEFVSEYNEEVIQMNKKTDLINSKSLKMINGKNRYNIRKRVKKIKSVNKNNIIFNENNTISSINNNKRKLKIKLFNDDEIKLLERNSNNITNSSGKKGRNRSYKNNLKNYVLKKN